MGMPAVVVSHHGDGDVAKLGLARQFGFLQVGHADDIHAQASIDVRFRLGGKLRSFHAQVGSTALADDANFLARRFDHASQFSANRISKGDVGRDAAAEKSVYAMAGTIEELIGDDEVQRFMLFFQRSDGGNGNDAVYSQLLEAVNVGTEIQFAGQDTMAASMAR